MDYSNALFHIKAGKKVRHDSYKGGMYLRLSDNGKSLVQGYPAVDHEGKVTASEIFANVDNSTQVSGEWHLVD